MRILGTLATALFAAITILPAHRAHSHIQSAASPQAPAQASAQADAQALTHRYRILAEQAYMEGQSLRRQ
jgi:hypothetical protein